MTLTVIRTIKPSEAGRILDLIRLVERYRPSLGLPLTVVLAARLGARWSDIGRGIMLIGSKGSGKGDIIEATQIPQIGFPVIAGDDLHAKHVRKVLEAQATAGRPIHRIAVQFEDLASLSEDRTKMRRVLSYGSRQISQLKATHTSYYDDPGDVHVFESVSWACGMTPETYMTVKRQAPFRSIWSDRFSRFVMIKTREDEARIQHYEDHGPYMSLAGLTQKIQDLVPAERDLPDEIKIAIDGDEIRAAAARMWGPWTADPDAIKKGGIGREQHAARRVAKFLRSDLRGLAAISGHHEATHSHLAILELSKVYYRVGSLDPVDLALVHHACASKSVEELCEAMDLSVWTVMDHLRRLQGYGLVHLSARDADPWNGRVGPGHYFDGPLEDIAAIWKR